MGYIDYLKGGLDVNGNMKWYYRFYSDNHTEVTDYFSFLGRKVRLKYCSAILLHIQPDVLFEMFNNDTTFINYRLTELDKAQKIVDNCNHNGFCTTLCHPMHRERCNKLINLDRYRKINKLINEALRTPKYNYINKGTKDEYDKQASKKLSFESFSNVNKLNAKQNVPKYTISTIVNNGNTCRLHDEPGNEYIIDIVHILKDIIDLKIHVTNLDMIRNWKNFN